MYYLKKLQFQELGSPDANGKISRWRYFLISKESGDFFPPLSETALNDTQLIPILTDEGQKKVYCSLVYHNDKFHGSTAKQPRNEYRLYLNTTIDPDRHYFNPSDIVVFSKLMDENDEFVYQMNLFTANDENYSVLNEVIENAPLRGAHALFEQELDFINVVEEVQADILVPEEVKKTIQAQDEELKDEIGESSIEQIEQSRGANLFNSSSFRDFVLLGYQGRCAITNEVISYERLNNLEAAHIKPKAHTGSFLPCNGIAMSRDMHWAFDKGMFTINEDYRVQVHDDIRETCLNKYHNQIISLPKDDFFKPEKLFLAYHQSNIFGLFKTSGGIRALR